MRCIVARGRIANYLLLSLLTSPDDAKAKDEDNIIFYLQSKRYQLLEEKIDVEKMTSHPIFVGKWFDRIIYSIPTSGYMRGGYGRGSSTQVTKKHKDHVTTFFRNAEKLIYPHGEIRVRISTYEHNSGGGVESLGLLVR